MDGERRAWTAQLFCEAEVTLYVLLAKTLAALSFVAGLVWGWHHFTERYREEGRMEVRAEWDLDKVARRKLVTEITLAWNDQRIAAEAAEKERDEERAKRIATATIRAKTLAPEVAGVVVPGAALRVLDVAIADSPAFAGTADHAYKTPPAATAATADDSDGTVGALTEWGVRVIGLYDACRDMVTAWQAFYAGLQKDQPKKAKAE